MEWRPLRRKVSLGAFLIVICLLGLSVVQIPRLASPHWTGRDGAQGQTRRRRKDSVSQHRLLANGAWGVRADRYAADTDSRWQLLAAHPELRQYLQRLGEQELRADAHDAYWQLFG